MIKQERGQHTHIHTHSLSNMTFHTHTHLIGQLLCAVARVIGRVVRTHVHGVEDPVCELLWRCRRVRLVVCDTPDIPEDLVVAGLYGFHNEVAHGAHDACG